MATRAPLRAAFGLLGALPGRRGQATRHLLDLVGLDDIADLHVLVALERRAALVAARHLACVLFEALEAADAPVVDDDVVAQEPRPRTAHDLAVADEAARHLADAGDVERLPHLGPAEDLLLQRRLEEALERVAHVVQ